MSTNEETPRISASPQAAPPAVRKGVLAAWVLFALVAGFVLGANLFAVLGYLLSNPGQRPASWPGWNLLFYGLAFGLPLLLAGLALWLGLKGRLPGVQR